MNYQMLVNKKNPVPNNFQINNMVDVDSNYRDDVKLEKLVNEAWIKLKKQVLLQGFIIDIESGYRDLDYQKRILNELIKEKGEEYAYKAAALPGYSEHNTGLALDYCIFDNNRFYIETEIDGMEASKYTNSIAYQYGFIVRYPKGKEDITGYMYEPWHLRYVGEELAKYLYENKLTLDEYYMKEN